MRRYVAVLVLMVWIIPVAARSSVGYIKAGNAGTYDNFGANLATDGISIMVAAPGEASAFINNPLDDSALAAGAAYVFNVELPTNQAYIKASNAEAGDVFSESIAIAGDRLAVGAWGEDSSDPLEPANNMTSSAGAVYTYQYIEGLWQTPQYIKSLDPEQNDYFGSSVALNAEHLIIGMRGDDSGNSDVFDNSLSDSGAVYTLVQENNQWLYEAFLKAEPPQAAAQFGSSLAVYGNLLAVGAWGYTNNQGAVYIFEYTNNQWSQIALITANNGVANDYFGISLDLNATQLVVGAEAQAGSGAVYLFDTTNWHQQAVLKPSNPNIGDYFGSTVALDNDTLLIGAWGEDSTTFEPSDNSGLQVGAAYVFKQKGNQWFQTDYLKAPNAQSGDLFGHSVAITTDYLWIGAWGESSNTAVDPNNNMAELAGAVYQFRRRNLAQVYLPMLNK